MQNIVQIERNVKNNFLTIVWTYANKLQTNRKSVGVFQFMFN